LRASLAASGGLARGILDAPLGFFPSKVVPPAALFGLPPETPLTCLACIARRQHTARTSGCRSATDWPDVSIASHGDDRTTFLGFSCQLVPARWKRRRPWLWVHLTGDQVLPPDPTLIYGAVLQTFRPEPCGTNLRHPSRSPAACTPWSVFQDGPYTGLLQCSGHGIG
jgi:hypothetical protein